VQEERKILAGGSDGGQHVRHQACRSCR
jgi:hypothetical protein